METIFNLSSVLTMPFWFLSMVLPPRRWTRRLMAQRLSNPASARRLHLAEGTVKN